MHINEEVNLIIDN